MIKALVVTVVLLSAGAGAVYYVKANAAKNAEAASQETQVRTLKAEKGTIDLRVATTGRVASNLDVEIKSKASGTIINIPFDVSDEVTSGDLLVELDPVDELRNVTQREIMLNSAKAKLAQAKQQFEMTQTDLDTGTSSAMASLEEARMKSTESKSKLIRQEELFTKKLISREELDNARSEAAATERALTQAQLSIVETQKLPRQLELRRHDISLQDAEVRRADVELENAMQRLKETKIFAPMDGVITERKIQKGQIIASGTTNVGGGTTLMTLSDISRMFVSANVDESDIGKVEAGQTARITADAYPGKRFRGEVVRVATKGVSNSNVVTFEVKIEIDPEGLELLMPEMTANVEIQAERREDVIVVDNQAVQFGREGYYVEVPAAGGKTEKKIVKTGLTDGLNTEILEGLTEGQEVALPTSVQSRWARSEGGPGGQGGRGGDQNSGQRFSRGMQRAAWGMSGAGRR